MKTSISWLAAVVLALSGLAACSDDSDPAEDPTTEATSEPTTEEPTTEEPPTEEPPTEEPTTEEPTEGDTTEEPTEDGTTGATGGDVTEFCSAFEQVSEDEDITVDELTTQLETLRESAPDEVSDQVQVVEENVQRLIGALESVGLDASALEGETLSSRQQRLLQQAAEASGYDEQASDAAAEDIEAWTSENCPA